MADLRIINPGSQGGLSSSAPTPSFDGALYWNRLNLTIPPFTTLLIDTGVHQGNRDHLDPILGVTPTDETNIPSFTDQSGIQVISELPVIPGTPPASRVMIVPLVPFAPWMQVAMPTEPFWNPATRSVNIVLTNTGLTLVQINALIWDPSFFNGPGKADVYTNMPDVLGQ